MLHSRCVNFIVGHVFARISVPIVAGIFFLLSVGQGAYFFQCKREFLQAQMEAGRLYQQTEIFKKKKRRQEEWLARHASSDPQFLGTFFEAYRPLQKEREQLERVSDHPALAEGKKVRERLSFLQGPQQQIHFVEKKREPSPFWNESEGRLLHPVQIDHKDLEYLLRLIDEVPGEALPLYAGRPELMSRDFSLSAVEGGFEWNWKFLKRER